MKKPDLSNSTDRRQFLGSIATGAAALGIATLGGPLSLQAAAGELPKENADSPDAWFDQIKGKHRIIFDCTRPNDILPFVWPRVFLLTNAATGSTEKDCNAVVILRHDAIPYAFEDKIWAKYKFGDVFKVTDPATKASSVRNPFWKPKPGEYKVPGFGVVNIGINELQDSGVMFGVCDAAMTVFSAAVAQGMNMDPAAVKKEWLEGLLPKIQVMPSGVWAVGRAQEHGCAYCFAG